MAAALCVYAAIWLAFRFLDWLFSLFAGVSFGLIDLIVFTEDIWAALGIYLVVLITLYYASPSAAQRVLHRAVYIYRIAAFPYSQFWRSFATESSKQMKARHTQRKLHRAERRKFRGTKLR